MRLWNQLNRLCWRVVTASDPSKEFPSFQVNWAWVQSQCFFLRVRTFVFFPTVHVCKAHRSSHQVVTMRHPSGPGCQRSKRSLCTISRDQRGAMRSSLMRAFFHGKVAKTKAPTTPHMKEHGRWDHSVTNPCQTKLKPLYPLSKAPCHPSQCAASSFPSIILLLGPTCYFYPGSPSQNPYLIFHSSFPTSLP